MRGGVAGCGVPGLAGRADARSTTRNPPFHRWFPDSELNIALDRHVEAGEGNRAVLVYDSPVTGTKQTYTYAQLREEVATFAGVLRDLGVGEGRPGRGLHADGPRDRGRDAGLGAIRSVMFGGFGHQGARSPDR